MTTAVREERFPAGITYGLVGGPAFMTERVVTGSGHVKKNARWSMPLRKFEADTSMLNLEQTAELFAFIHAVAFGSLYNFRVKDLSDYQVTAGPAIGTVDGTNRVFQLAKRYVFGGYSLTRTIAKPSSDVAPIVYIDAVVQPAANYAIDMTTGVLTFGVGHAPAAGTVVTWDGTFDVPCEFDEDYTPGTYETVKHLKFSSIGMTEVRL